MWVGRWETFAIITSLRKKFAPPLTAIQHHGLYTRELKHGRSKNARKVRDHYTRYASHTRHNVVDCDSLSNELSHGLCSSIRPSKIDCNKSSDDRARILNLRTDALRRHFALTSGLCLAVGSIVVDECDA